MGLPETFTRARQAGRGGDVGERHGTRTASGLLPTRGGRVGADARTPADERAADELQERRGACGRASIRLFTLPPRRRGRASLATLRRFFSSSADSRSRRLNSPAPSCCPRSSPVAGRRRPARSSTTTPAGCREIAWFERSRRRRSRRPSRSSALAFWNHARSDLGIELDGLARVIERLGRVARCGCNRRSG